MQLCRHTCRDETTYAGVLLRACNMSAGTQVHACVCACHTCNYAWNKVLAFAHSYMCVYIGLFMRARLHPDTGR